MEISINIPCAIRLLLPLVLVGSVPLLAASEPIQFSQKFDRIIQSRGRDNNGEYVWRTGEKIEALFQVRPVSNSPYPHSDCKWLLTKAYPIVLYALEDGDIELSDSFYLNGYNDYLASTLRAWHGQSFRGVVEILGLNKPVHHNGGPMYQARLVRWTAPSSPVNPSATVIAKLPIGSEVIVRGTVVELTPKFINVQALDNKYRILGKGNRLRIEADLGGVIKTLTGEDLVQVGDSVQVRARVGVRGLETPRSETCLLWNSAGQNPRYDAYRVERARMSWLLKQIKDAIAIKDWPEVIEVRRELALVKMTPSEAQLLESYLLALQPDDG